MNKHLFALIAAVLMLAACGSPNGVAARRAQKTGDTSSVQIVATSAPTPAELDTPSEPAPEAAPAPEPPDQTTMDGALTVALPYGALAMLQFILLAVGTLQHPTRRRVGIGLISFALCAAAALLALFAGTAGDVIGFAFVCIMALVAMSRTFRRHEDIKILAPPGRLTHG